MARPKLSKGETEKMLARAVEARRDGMHTHDVYLQFKQVGRTRVRARLMAEGLLGRDPFPMDRIRHVCNAPSAQWGN